MKNLWTPWRMEHVSGNIKKRAGCLFEPPGTCFQDKELLLLYRDNHTVVLLNRFPYANGHLLVAPSRHVSCITELTIEENTRLSTMIRQCSSIIKQHFDPDGINIGAAAGAGIADHLHAHIIPRWQDDHNFMTVVGEIRTIPEHIERTFDALSPLFSRLNKS